MLDVESSLCNIRSKVKVVGHRKVKNVFLVISRRRIVAESRDGCQHVGEINTNIQYNTKLANTTNFCILHFGL